MIENYGAALNAATLPAHSYSGLLPQAIVQVSVIGLVPVA
jgi:hypothetical protein